MKTITFIPCKMVFQWLPRLRLAGLTFGLGLCLASRAECPCETQDQAALRLAYENAQATGGKIGNPLADSAVSATATADTPKYLDPSLPIEERIDDLLPRLTLEEKVTQLSDDWGSKGIPRLKIPALLKTEGLHGQSYSPGPTFLPIPREMHSIFST